MRRSLRGGLFNNAWVILVACLSGGLLLAIGRYLRIIYGPAELESNYTVIWKPLAEAVENGTSLYMDGAADNKPPLFLLLNQLISLTDNPELIYLLLVGIANGVGAFLIWVLVRRRWEATIGLLAATFFLLSIPHIRGTVINIRSLAVVLILYGFVTDRSILRGVVIAVAGLLIQFSVLAIPAMMLDGLNRTPRQSRFRWGIIFVVSGLLTVIGSFAIVAGFWGTESALAGFYWSFGIDLGVVSSPVNPSATPPLAYAGGGGAGGGGPSLSNPLLWGGYLFYRGGLLFPLLGLATVGTYRIAASGVQESLDRTIFLLSAVLLAASLLVRSYPSYWILPLPFVAVLAALGISDGLPTESTG